MKDCELQIRGFSTPHERFSRRTLLKTVLTVAGGSSLASIAAACEPSVTACTEGIRQITPGEKIFSDEESRSLISVAGKVLKPELLSPSQCVIDLKRLPDNATDDYQRADGSTVQASGVTTKIMSIRNVSSQDEFQVRKTVKDNNEISTSVSVITAEYKRNSGRSTPQVLSDEELIEHASGYINIPRDIAWTRQQGQNYVPGTYPLEYLKGISRSTNQVIELANSKFISVVITP